MYDCDDYQESWTLIPWIAVINPNTDDWDRVFKENWVGNEVQVACQSPATASQGDMNGTAFHLAEEQAAQGVKSFELIPFADSENPQADAAVLNFESSLFRAGASMTEADLLEFTSVLAIDASTSAVSEVIIAAPRDSFVATLSNINLSAFAHRREIERLPGTRSRDAPSSFMFACPNRVHGCKHKASTRADIELHATRCKLTSAEAASKLFPCSRWCDKVPNIFRGALCHGENSSLPLILLIS